jgi:two-component system sensor histidine kinase RpfC
VTRAGDAARTPGGGGPPPHGRLAVLRRRLSGRPDTEHEQALIRIAIVALLLGPFALLAVLLPDPAGFDQGALLAGVYLLISLGYLAWIVADPGVSRVRRVLGMITDHTALSLVVWQGDAWVGALYPIYLWITFGNGFRYGVPYLAAAAVFSGIVFAAAAWLNPFWHNYMALTIGLGLGLIVLPAYVASLIRKLTEAKRVAEAANRAKSRFLATMSHELRTPLNAVIGMSDLLGATKLDRDQAEMVGTVGSSGRALLALINDILDLAKIESGKSELQADDFDLAGELAAAVGMLRPQARQKGLDVGLLVDADVPVRVRGDVRHLRQILLNLLSNAVKFTQQGGVTLRVSRQARPGGHWLRLQVRDTGIGIAAEDRQRVFDAFTQSDDDANRHHGGTGLGLAIARQLAQTMGGDIALDSEPGQGSRFTLDLPVDAAATAAPAQPAPAFRIAAPGQAASREVGQALEAAGLSTGGAPDAGTPDGGAEEVAICVDLRGATAHGQDAAAALADTQLGETLGQLAAEAHGCLLLAPTDGTVPERVVRRLGIAVQIAGAQPSARQLADAAALLSALSDRPGQSSTLAEQLAPTKARRHARVLVVEDNPVNRKVTAKILERGGHTPLLASSGEEALDRIEEGGVDAVLMDVNMPGDSGIDTAKLLRFTQLGAGARLPILALTADATVATREECLNAGMDDFITKPVDAGRLLQALDAHLPPPDAQAPETAPDDGALEDVPVVDSAAVDTLRDLDPDGGFLHEVVREFVQDTEDLVSQLETALGRDRPAQAQDLLHAVKSSAGNVGAARLRACAVEQARRLRSGVQPAAADTAAWLRREAERYRTDVAALLPGGEPVPAAARRRAGAADEADDADQSDESAGARIVPLHRPSRLH